MANEGARRAAALHLPRTPSAGGQRERCYRSITGAEQGLATSLAFRAGRSVPSLISKGISIGSLSKTLRLAQNMRHKSQGTGLWAALG